jgi:transcription termination factor Rho
MTESAERPLLAEQPEEPKKPTRRRTAAAKPRATKAGKAAAEDEAVSTAKPKAAAKPKTTRKKAGAEIPAEPVQAAETDVVRKTEAEPPTAIEAPTPAAAVPPALMPPATPPAIEEWSPSARQSAAETPSANAPRVATGADLPLPISDAPAAPRRYPVYVPRAVAKQLEAEGKSAPLAVTSEGEVPREILDAVAAASANASQNAPGRQRDRDPRDQREHQRDQRDSRDRGHNRDRDSRRHQQREAIPRELAEDVAPEPLQGEVDPNELFEGEGIIEISGKGFGFIRDAKRSFAQTPMDIFVTPEFVRSYNLRDGQWIKGQTRRGGRGAQLHKLLAVNGDDPETVKNLPVFDELTVISPEKRIRLETVPDRYTTRIVDLFCPIGKGQRGLIVAPPRTGKTTLLQHIGDAVIKNHPEVKLLILLVDERPEEVTDIRRNVTGAELFASSNDMDVKSHTRMAQLCIERAKRLVEQGKDVFILLDSITRVGRAFNNAMSGGGRTGSGGLDTRAMELPRRLFAAARNTEEAGSLTIIGTVLIETNSRMDEIIFQEFKGTGNMELMLDRRISEQRIYPAIDIFLSGTRREELLLPEEDLRKISIIRRGLAGYKPIEAIERLLFFAKKFPTNAEMLAGIPG